MSAPREELAAAVERALAAAADDPSARLALRRGFYERHAPSLGRAELEFTRWMIARGALQPRERGGSAWWRRIQARLAYDAELAARLYRCGVTSDPSPSVDRWLRLLARPEPRAWYRAHNASVALGYEEALEDARREPHAERRLCLTVLGRILVAQSMMEGAALGRLGAVLADPRAPSIRLALERAALYPREYPASAPAGLEARLVGSVDRRWIGGRLEALAERASRWLGVPALPDTARRYAALAGGEPA